MLLEDGGVWGDTQVVLLVGVIAGSGARLTILVNSTDEILL